MRTIDGFVVVLASLPIVGLVMAIYTGYKAWLLLLFALALFL